MDPIIIWISLGLFVLLYILIEYLGKRSYQDNKNAFVLESRQATGEQLADRIFAENGLNLETVHRDSAFDDRFHYRKNTLIISATGQKSRTVAAVNAVVREAFRAVLFNRKRFGYYCLYLFEDILKTLTLIAIPGFFVGLIISNNYVLFACLVSFFLLAGYNLVLGRNERRISELANRYVEEGKIFNQKAQKEFEKLNELAERAPLYSTFNAIRQVNVIFETLMKRKKAG